jgi:REP element-mobilizing transposase RayT
MKRPRTEAQWWHVYARGARRLALFHEEQDYWKYVHILQAALLASGCLLIGYALMSNHYHLMLHGTSVQLTRCMRRVNHLYSLYHNKKYNLSGHAFDGPYRAHLQATPFLLLRKLAYVFLNPVTAGMVQRPEDYFWSGYGSFMGLAVSPLPVDSSLVLPYLDPDSERAKAKFAGIVSQETSRARRKSGEIPTALEINRQEFVWLLQHARASARPAGEPDPVEIAIYWGSRCGIPPRAMAAELGMTSSYPVYQVLKKFKTAAKADPSLAARLSPP